MGFITFEKAENSTWAEHIILFLEYSQLVSQILLVCCNSYAMKTEENEYYRDKKYFFDIITYVFKLLNPSFLMSFGESNGTTASTLCLALGVSLLKLVLFGYIIYIAYSKKQSENPTLVGLWRWVFRLQARVLCFFMTSFWIRSLLGMENEGFRLLGMSRAGCIIIFSIPMAVENLFSIYLETQFCYRLPSKRFLASKGFQMSLVTLAQKMILQIIQLSFKTPSLACLWVFTSLNIVLCLVRSQLFYTTLPLYKIQALLYQSDLLSVVNSVSLACFFQTLLKATRYSEIDSNFPIIFAIVLSFLSAKVSRGYLNQLILELLTSRNSKNDLPDLLVHKISFTKQFQKRLEIPGKKNPKLPWVTLVAKSVSSRINDILNTEKDVNENQKNDDGIDMSFVFLGFLDNLSKLFPENSMIKLHIAKICAKKPELYARAIKISTEIASNFWSKDYITFSFLLSKIQRAITHASMISHTKLDLYTYVKSQVFYEKLKDEISQQTQLTIDLCKNILQDVTDIGGIFNYAQEIHKHRVKIEKKMANFSSKIPEHFMAPVKLWAEYQLALNFSLHDYQKFNDVYFSKYSKCEKYFKSSDLVQENLYQETNAFLLLSGQKLDNGQILLCNKSLEDLCGTKSDSILGSHVSSLFSSSLQVPFAEIFKQLFESEKASILNQTTRAFLKHKNGFLIEVDFYLRIHPYIAENLYLNMLIRQVPGENEYLFLRENGDIEGATQHLWKKLNLDSTKPASSTPATINIKALSTELAKANDAFNLIEKQQQQQNLVAPPPTDSPKANPENLAVKKRNFAEAVNRSGYFLTKNRALEIYSQYSSDPQKVKIWPVKNALGVSREYIYDCQISVLSYGSVSMKLLKLHEVFEFDNDDDSPRRGRGKSIPSFGLLNIEQQQQKNNVTNQSFSSMGEESENIDCEEIKHTDRLVTEWRNTLMTTEGNLISPRTDRSHIQLLTPITEEKPTKPLNLPTSNSLLSEQDPVALRKSKIKKMKSMHSGNPLSQTLTETKVHKVFQTAINAKSYSRVLRALYSVFYAILLLSFGCLIAHKIFSDATYDDLAIKKDLLVSAQLRTFYVIRIATTCRGGYLQIAGALVADSVAYLSVLQLIDVSHTWIAELTSANKQIISKIDYLESDIKAELFKRDVEVVGTYLNSSEKVSHGMTSFQAIDEIQLSFQRLYNLPKAELLGNPGLHLFGYIALNSVNDLVSKNLEITDLFIETVERERDLLRLTMLLYITILPLLLAIIVFTLIYTIWRQYNVEKNHMLAFVKLHPQGVKTLFNTLNKFQKRLLEEEKFEEKDAMKLLISPVAMSIYHKTQGSQRIKYSEIQRKYWNYTLRVLCYATILVGIIIWNFVCGQNSSRIIYKRQNQLQFANEISVKVSLTYISYSELFGSNNTNYVNHQLPYDSLVATMAELDRIQNQLKTVFLEDDNSYDPEIEALLFNSTCSGLWSLFRGYCEYLEERDQNTGLNYVLALFRLYLVNKPQQYLQVGKTTLTQIVAAGLEGFDILLWSSGTAAAEAQLISQLINAKLKEDISNGRTERTVILVIFVISLVVVSVLMWKHILVKISNVNNDFKKVLQVFPADFVLSSFLLKNFLMESSQAIQHF